MITIMREKKPPNKVRGHWPSGKERALSSDNCRIEKSGEG
jgi:hypothetical protein